MKPTKNLPHAALLVALLLPAVLFAQEGSIRFAQQLSWQQILEKAKQENKYIFMDCYASWCGPCKEMDKKIYPDGEVGAFVNARFISIKIQIDSTKNDSPEIVAWREDTRRIAREDSVNAFPTFLFFSPEGRLVHKSIGFCPKPQFLSLVNDAIDPDKQVYHLLEAFHSGSLAVKDYAKLIAALEKAGNRPEAAAVADRYIHQYLLKLPSNKLLTKDNIDLMGSYLKIPGDPVFKVFWQRGNEIDQLVNQPGYVHNVLFNVIIKNEVLPELWSDAARKHRKISKPDWQGLTDRVSRKYSKEFGEETVNYAQQIWYRQTKEWPQLLLAKIEELEKFETGKDGLLKDMDGMKASSVNNWMYDEFFKRSNDENILKKALAWQKQVIDHHPQEPDYLDTYANLLHKLGHKEEAIQWETKAIDLNVADTQKNNKHPDAGLQQTLGKMKAGLPTWDTN